MTGAPARSTGKERPAPRRRVLFSLRLPGARLSSRARSRGYGSARIEVDLCVHDDAVGRLQLNRIGHVEERVAGQHAEGAIEPERQEVEERIRLVGEW